MITTGADRLAATGWAAVRGRRVGVLTNPTGVLSADLTGIVDAMIGDGVEVGGVLGPEHGFRGTAQAGAAEPTTTDPRTGVVVHDLYGADPDRFVECYAEAGIDTVVVDLPDIGARFFTYTSTMHDAMVAAARSGIAVVVLDRPNPVGGRARGPVLDPAYGSFVGRLPIAQAHGMTLGELAVMINAEVLPAPVDLEVVTVDGWSAEMIFADTGLPWVPPSPNLPTPDSALLYPGTGMIEGTNLSEGRGTTRPFELVGAPYVDHRLAASFNAAGLPGVLARATGFVPAAGKHAGLLCEGVQLHLTDPRRLDPVAVAVELLGCCRELYPEFGWRLDDAGAPDGRWIDLLTGSSTFRTAFDAGAAAADLAAGWAEDLAAFEKRREPYLRYPRAAVGRSG